MSRSESETVSITMLMQNLWGEARNISGTMDIDDIYVTVTDAIGSWDASGSIVNFGFMFTARF